MEYNIIIVDGSGTIYAELAAILKKINIRTLRAGNDSEALKLAEEETDISALIWGIEADDNGNFEAMHSLKENEKFADIPIIAVSGVSDRKHIVKAIESGACDYIVLPFDRPAVVEKISKLLGITVQSSARECIYSDIAVFSLAEMLSKEVKAASRGGYPLSFIAATILAEEGSEDYDSDAVEILSMFYALIKTKLRETDTIFYYGRESLIVLLPFADLKGAAAVENKIQHIYNHHSGIRKKNTGFRLATASITCPDDGKVGSKLIEKLNCRLQQAVEIENSAKSKGD